MSELKNVLEALDGCLARIDGGRDALTQALEPLEEAGQPHAFGVLLESRDAEAQQALTEAAQAAEDIVRVAQTLERVHSIVTQYRHNISEGVSSRSHVPSVSASPKGPVESAPKFDTVEWADDVRQRIQHRKPTVGLVFDDHGCQELTDLDDLRSGPDATAREIDAFLKNHPQFPEQRRADVPIASSEHVETKIAMEMRKRGIDHLTVVINNPRGVCRGEWGCRPAVNAILPRGCSITVWLPGTDVSSELHGGSIT